MAGLALAALAANPVEARTILFVGNSFTYGANSPVRAYRPDLVTDLNQEGIGGVPALFKTFTDEAGLDYTVSLETAGGKGLDFHYAQKRDLIVKPWDVVILQGYSTLDEHHPGDPAIHVASAARLAALFRQANPKVEVALTATWTRADQTYLPTGHWYGKPVTAMADDLRAASDLARKQSKDIDAVLPVGQTWSRAMAEGIADPDPYDGIAFGKLDLWTWDQYHASAAGYYLEALVVFGRITGRDPRALGPHEKAANAIGLSATQAGALQGVAWEQLQAEH
jgi:hypothetical protein